MNECACVQINTCLYAFNAQADKICNTIYTLCGAFFSAEIAFINIFGALWTFRTGFVFGPGRFLVWVVKLMLTIAENQRATNGKTTTIQVVRVRSERLYTNTNSYV